MVNKKGVEFCSYCGKIIKRANKDELHQSEI
jgi:hypothetical protein